MPTSYTIALVPRSQERINDVLSAMEQGRFRVLQAEETNVLSPREQPRERVRIGNQRRELTAIVSRPVPVLSDRGIIDVDYAADGGRIHLVPNHSLGNRALLYEVDLPPADLRYALRLRPVRMLYGQPVAADITGYDGCNLRLAFAGGTPAALALTVDSENFQGQVTLPPAQEQSLASASGSVTVAEGTNRSGGGCVAGQLPVALRPPDRTAHSLTGDVTVSSGRWFLVQVAPQRMGRLASDMAGQAFERRQQLFQALLGAVDRGYRGHRQSLVAGDIVRVSRVESADRAPLRELALTSGASTRQPTETLSLPIERIAELADFESDRAAVEPWDAMDAVREYATLQGPIGPRSAVLVLATTMSRADVACRTWRTEMSRTAAERNVAMRAIIAANVRAAEIATALRLQRPSREGGFYECPHNRDEDASNTNVFVYSFVDLVEQAADADARLGSMTETVSGLIEEILPR